MDNKKAAKRNPNIIPIQIRFPKATWEEIKQLAKKDHRSSNGEVISFLQEQIKQRKKREKEEDTT